MMWMKKTDDPNEAPVGLTKLWDVDPDPFPGAASHHSGCH